MRAFVYIYKVCPSHCTFLFLSPSVLSMPSLSLYLSISRPLCMRVSLVLSPPLLSHACSVPLCLPLASFLHMLTHVSSSHHTQHRYPSPVKRAAQGYSPLAAPRSRLGKARQGYSVPGVHNNFPSSLIQSTVFISHDQFFFFLSFFFHISGSAACFFFYLQLWKP